MELAGKTKHIVRGTLSGSAAEQAGVRLGSELIAVGNTAVRGKAHKEVVSLLGSAKRPVRLQFANATAGAGEEAGAEAGEAAQAEAEAGAAGGAGAEAEAAAETAQVAEIVPLDAAQGAAAPDAAPDGEKVKDSLRTAATAEQKADAPSSMLIPAPSPLRPAQPSPDSGFGNSLIPVNGSGFESTSGSNRDREWSTEESGYSASRAITQYNTSELDSSADVSLFSASRAVVPYGDSQPQPQPTRALVPLTSAQNSSPQARAASASKPGESASEAGGSDVSASSRPHVYEVTLLDTSIGMSVRSYGTAQGGRRRFVHVVTQLVESGAAKRGGVESGSRLVRINDTPAATLPHDAVMRYLAKLHVEADQLVLVFGSCSSGKVNPEDDDVEEEVPMFVDKRYEPRPKEVSLIKGINGLGVKMELSDNKEMFLIKAFKSSETGLQGAAERSKKLQIGDAILEVNGEPGRTAATAAARRTGRRLPAARGARRSSWSRGGAEPKPRARPSKPPIDLQGAVKLLRDSPEMLKLTVLARRVDKEEVKKQKRRKNSLERGIGHVVDPEKQVRAPDPAGLHNPGPADRWEEAFEAALCGSLNAVKDEVIQHWSRINRIQKDTGDTLLHMLCREGYVEGARFVLDPANHSAMERVQLNCVRVKNKKGRTPLLLAFTPPHLTGAARGQWPIEDKEPNDTVMTCGGEDARTRIVELLIRSGADLDVLDLNDFTATMLAGMWGWGKCTRNLVRAGADAMRANAVGQTALHLACKYGQEQSAIALLEELPQAILGLVLEKKDDRGNNPMHYAAAAGLDEVIERIIAKGGDPMAPNTKDETPLKLAVRSGRTRAASVLMHVPNMMRRKSAVAAAAGDMREYLMRRMAENAYGSKKKKEKKKEKKEKQYQRMTPEERELEMRRSESVNYRKQGDWEQFNDPYNGNRVYYYNHATKESSWDQPPGFAADPRDAPRMLGRGENVSLWPQHDKPPRKIQVIGS
eukprot:g5535.t1